MNYKIRVENEAESKECQELFFELGYKWIDIGAVYYKISPTFNYITAYCNGKTLAQGHGLDAKREITLPGLRDMVVLKRNDVGDAQYVDAHGFKIYINSDNNVYYFEHRQFNNGQHHTWVESGINGHRPESLKDEYISELKPIEKAMKEYLRKNDDGSYSYIGSIHPCNVNDSLVEIPDGAEIYVGLGGVNGFYKNNFKRVWDQGNWEDTVYNDENLKIWNKSPVLWQRKTLNDQVASAETARQSEKVLKEILEGNLPEFDFEAIDAFIESNVEQDNVNQPVHYCSHPSGIECIEITRHHDFAIGNAIKYLWRAGLKDSGNEIQDLEKSIWYIQDKINQLKKQNENSCKD